MLYEFGSQSESRPLKSTAAQRALMKGQQAYCFKDEPKETGSSGCGNDVRLSTNHQNKYILNWTAYYSLSQIHKVSSSCHYSSILKQFQSFHSIYRNSTSMLFQSQAMLIFTKKGSEGSQVVLDLVICLKGILRFNIAVGLPVNPIFAFYAYACPLVGLQPVFGRLPISSELGYVLITIPPCLVLHRRVDDAII